MRRIALLALVALSLPAVAQVYKWVDEKGVAHYSETPPPDGKAAKIELKPSTGTPPPVPETDWKQKELDARQQRIQKEQKEQQREAQEHNQEAARHNKCLEARRRLDLMQRPAAVYHFNEKGEKVYYDDAERAREIASLQASAKTYCN
jgi:Domain of unknown function (DUF4124)